MRISKRQFLAGSAAVGVGLYAAGRLTGGRSLGPDRDLLAVFDGRSDVGRAFGDQARSAGIATIDLAADPEAFWTRARAGLGLADGGRLIGVTGWDDRVYLAAHFAAQTDRRRMRLRHEVRLDCCGLDPRADHRHDLLQLALSEGPARAPARLAVAGRGGTLFAWRIA